MDWTNSWDFPDAEKKDYSRYFRAKVLPQVTELLTKYGDIFLIWFDTPMTISAEESQELFDLVKRLQPNCLVNTRISNGLGDYTSMGDNEIPDADFDMPAESPTTLNDTWGYKSFDENWKDAEQVLAIKKHLNDRGVNYLLNVGPDAMGRIPAPAAQILRKVGKG
jgi:alpha-L-fucosidase